MDKIIHGKRWSPREVNVTKEWAEEEARNMRAYGMEVKVKPLANGKYSVWIHNPAWDSPEFVPRKRKPANEKFGEQDEAKIIYTDRNGKECSKTIKIPKKRFRYEFGIAKQGAGYVTLSYFTQTPSTIQDIIKKGGSIGKFYKEIRVVLPKGAGRARLKVGKRVISVAK